MSARKEAISTAFYREWEYQNGEGACHPDIDLIIDHLDERLLDDEQALEILYALFSLALQGQPGNPLTLAGLDMAYTEAMAESLAINTMKAAIAAHEARVGGGE